MSDNRDKKQKAVALQYDSSLPAPFLIAKGKQDLANKILMLAREHGIEIVRDTELADMLFEIDTGTFIPEELYGIIAELLVYVMKTQEHE